MKYGENKLQEIVDKYVENVIQQDFEDWCHSTVFIEAFWDEHIKKGHPVLMFSIDGAQLYHSKLSDCWISTWTIFNFDPKTGHYKKTSVLYGSVIPGPNTPKILESFLFQTFTTYPCFSMKVYPYGMCLQIFCVSITHSL